MFMRSAALLLTQFKFWIQVTEKAKAIYFFKKNVYPYCCAFCPYSESLNSYRLDRKHKQNQILDFRILAFLHKMAWYPAS